MRTTYRFCYIWLTICVYTAYKPMPIFAMSCNSATSESYYSLITKDRESLPRQLKNRITKLTKYNLESMTLVKDASSNLVLVTPIAKIIIFTPDGKVLFGSLKGSINNGAILNTRVAFLDSKSDENKKHKLMTYEELTTKINTAKPNEIQFYPNYNTKEINLHGETATPVITPIKEKMASAVKYDATTYKTLNKSKEFLPEKIQQAISHHVKSDYSSLELLKDLNSNIILISANTRLVIFSPEGRIAIGKLSGPLDKEIGRANFRFGGAIKEWNIGSALLPKSELLNKILRAKPSEINFKSENTKEVNLNKHTPLLGTTVGIDLELPVIELEANIASHDIGWHSYSGKKLNVIFSKENGTKVNTIQTVNTVSSYKKSEPNVLAALKKLDNHPQQNYTIKSEVGLWIFRVNGKDIYSSETFSSGHFKELSLEHGEQKIVDLMNELMEKLPDADVSELILAHNHPLPNAPLSPADLATLEALVKRLPLGGKLTILATSGDLIFSASRLNEE